MSCHVYFERCLSSIVYVLLLMQHAAITMQAIWSMGIKHIVAHLNIPKTRKASENLTTSVTKWYRK